MLQDRTNMYSDSDEPASAPDADSSGDSASENQTALIPKSVFGKDVKPGDQITLKAVSVHGDEVACEKAGDSEKPEEEAPEPSGDDEDGGDQSPSAPGGLSSMLAD